MDVKIRSVLIVWGQQVKIFVFRSIPETRLCGNTKERVISVLPTQIPCLTWCRGDFWIRKGRTLTSRETEDGTDQRT